MSDKATGFSYASSGVDIEKANRAIKTLVKNFRPRGSGFGYPIDLGNHFAGAVDFGKLALVMCTDGVGSKILLADEMKRWDTIGIDCVAMNVNDAICLGARPIAMVDYIACKKVEENIIKEIGRGLAKGAAIAQINIIGGETAILPDMVCSLDLAGTCLGYVQKDRIITGKNVKPGEVIIGVKSTGIHSNGFTLIRKICKEKRLDLKSKADFDASRRLGDLLLTPTKIYVTEILEILSKVELSSIFHITGGGLNNLKRLDPHVKFLIENPIEPQPIFKYFMELAEIEPKEMYGTFNMGMGLALVCSEESSDQVLKIFGRDAKIVGRIEKGNGIEIKEKGEVIRF
jgi:phosphoribosylformylglycinamidine cyclo-ligase